MKRLNVEILSHKVVDEDLITVYGKDITEKFLTICKEKGLKCRNKQNDNPKIRSIAELVFSLDKESSGILLQSKEYLSNWQRSLEAALKVSLTGNGILGFVNAQSEDAITMRVAFVPILNGKIDYIGIIGSTNEECYTYKLKFQDVLNIINEEFKLPTVNVKGLQTISENKYKKEMNGIKKQKESLLSTLAEWQTDEKLINDMLMRVKERIVILKRQIKTVEDKIVEYENNHIIM